MLQGQQIGRYHLLQQIGSGGMGEVYLAEDRQIRQRVAIKIIRDDPADEEPTEKEARLFQREITAIARLDHSNILPLYDYGQVTLNGREFSYLVMPYRQEGTLTTWLRQLPTPSPLSLQDIAHIISQAADALQHAHEQHILHQDVKPSNFLIRIRREHPMRPDLLLTDFGIARFYASTSSVSQSVRGTPTYMAPEQWRGQAVPATDQYALAVMAYQLLTSQPPFRGRMEQIMHQHLEVAPLPPSALNPRLPKDVDVVLLHALAKKPQERFASISAFARAFQEAVTSATSQALPLPSSDSAAASGHSSPSPVEIPTPPPPPAIPTQKQTGAVSVTPHLLLPSKGLAMIGALRTRLSGRLNKRTWLLLTATLLIALSSTGIVYAGNAITAYQVSSNAMATSNAIIATSASNSRDETATASSYSTAFATVHAYLTPTAMAVINANATAAAATTNQYGQSNGTLVLDDPLKDNSKGYQWDETTSCGFSPSTNIASYDAKINAQNQFSTCAANALDAGDFAFQVQMTILSGNYGGVVFRADTQNSKFYYVQIDTYGVAVLYMYPDSSGSTAQNLGSGSVLTFLAPPQSNLIAVVARGKTISLYINGDSFLTVTDTTYSHGKIGVTAGTSPSGTSAEVLYTNAKVWKL
ncbi:MAG TPA: protein kinase [Ktedonosporobacter sp.]|nr:protein kinase [Ktedonosporobacter sp.]